MIVLSSCRVQKDVVDKNYLVDRYYSNYFFVGFYCIVCHFD